jgi:hypothetical protein
MMKDQHTKITGYRDLNQDTIDLMNKVKLHGQVLEELVQEVKLHVAGQRAAARELPTEEGDAELARLTAAEPERWTALARTHLQEALMFLTRAVAQPASF